LEEAQRLADQSRQRRDAGKYDEALPLAERALVIREQVLGLDILFANAGAGTIGPLAVATGAHFDQTFDVNVKGLFFTVQKALPLFKDGGSIILNSSVSNVLGVRSSRRSRQGPPRRREDQS
jgi:NAD(P)-dependent dehydrogenase (short-subunit alcohol dehydrogenase family)